MLLELHHQSIIGFDCFLFLRQKNLPSTLPRSLYLPLSGRLLRSNSRYGYSYAGGQACIYDRARMHSQAGAEGEAQIYGRSELGGTVRVTDNAHVFGDTKLVGSVRIGEDAFVGHTRGYCSLLNIGRPNQQTTAYRAADGSVRIAFGEDVYPIDRVNKAVVRAFNGNEDYRMYQAVIDLIKLKFNLA